MKKVIFSLAILMASTVGFSQNCLRVTAANLSNPSNDGNTFTLTIKYLTDGNKTLQTIVKCGNVVIFDSCYSTGVDGTKIYTGIICSGGFSNISATFTPRTGSCGSAACGPVQILPAGGPFVVPVKISSFNALRAGQIVNLNWETEIEIDSKEFIIERSEGREFYSVGTIAAKGNATTNQKYAFVDKNNSTNVSYYRLKNVDVDGKFTYTEIKTVSAANGEVINIYPNPARSNSKISIEGVSANSAIQLLDFSGKMLRNVTSNNLNLLDLSGVQKGIYLIRIVDKKTNEIFSKKINVTN